MAEQEQQQHVGEIVPGGESPSDVPGSPKSVVSASEHDVPHVPSLPTHEQKGMLPHEHVAGAGALPGTVSESGVAVLPDEQNPSMTSSAVGTHPRLYGTDIQHASMPSQEELGSDEEEGEPVTGGVGSLPGHLGEEGVAVLPGEREGPQKVQPAEDALELAREQEDYEHYHEDEDIKDIPMDAVKIAHVEAVQQQEEEAQKGTGKEKEGQRRKTEDKASQASYHPAEMHPSDADYSKQQHGRGEGLHGVPTHEVGPPGEKERERRRSPPPPHPSAKPAEGEQAKQPPAKKEKKEKKSWMERMKSEALGLFGKSEGKGKAGKPQEQESRPKAAGQAS